MTTHLRLLYRPKIYTAQYALAVLKQHCGSLLLAVPLG